ncbi:MAG TPA: hypothetical protein PK036_17065 [Geobacteraceae bacterium]|nr:hypothetical protein [Geobacteraceae bacterium]
MGEQSVRVSEYILRVVEKQLETNAPPQTRETLERLVGLGFGVEDAKHLIGSAIAAEMRSVVSESRPFNEERFLALLRGLPTTPS